MLDQPARHSALTVGGRACSSVRPRTAKRRKYRWLEGLDQVGLLAGHGRAFVGARHSWFLLARDEPDASGDVRQVPAVDGGILTGSASGQVGGDRDDVDHRAVPADRHRQGPPDRVAEQQPLQALRVVDRSPARLEHEVSGLQPGPVGR